MRYTERLKEENASLKKENKELKEALAEIKKGLAREGAKHSSTCPDEKYNWLHVKPQECEHDDILITGTAGALELLKAEISHVLSQRGVTTTGVLYCTDGEGYAFEIKCVLDEKELEAKHPIKYYEERDY